MRPGRDDGELVFLGRTDHQVKVRGHRVELEAIESVLTEVVEECAVVVDRGAEDRLVALVAPEPDDETIADMLDLARRRLPRYAVPSEVVGVPSIPRSRTGKVERAAAAALLAGRPHEGEQVVAPSEPPR